MDHEIARFNERITFQKNTVTVDRYKNHVNEWTDYYSCYSYASTYQYDREEKQVVIREDRTINFEVRWCSELKGLDSTHYRVLFHGAVYNIVNVDMMNFQRKTIRVRCEREEGGAANGKNSQD